MFIPSTFKRPVSSWKALNLRKTLLMASSVRLKPLNCSRLPCVYAQETLTFLLTQKRSEERFSRNAETELVCRLLLEKKKLECPGVLQPPQSRHHQLSQPLHDEA